MARDEDLDPGAAVKGYLDGELLLEFELPAPVSGKIGLWSKTDSVSEFDDFVATPAAAKK